MKKWIWLVSWILLSQQGYGTDAAYMFVTAASKESVLELIRSKRIQVNQRVSLRVGHEADPKIPAWQFAVMYGNFVAIEALQELQTPLDREFLEGHSIATLWDDPHHRWYQRRSEWNKKMKRWREDMIHVEKAALKANPMRLDHINAFFRRGNATQHAMISALQANRDVSTVEAELVLDPNREIEYFSILGPNGGDDMGRPNVRGPAWHVDVWKGDIAAIEALLERNIPLIMTSIEGASILDILRSQGAGLSIVIQGVKQFYALQEGVGGGRVRRGLSDPQVQWLEGGLTQSPVYSTLLGKLEKNLGLRGEAQ